MMYYLNYIQIYGHLTNQNHQHQCFIKIVIILNYLTE